MELLNKLTKDDPSEWNEETTLSTLDKLIFCKPTKDGAVELAFKETICADPDYRVFAKTDKDVKPEWKIPVDLCEQPADTCPTDQCENSYAMSLSFNSTLNCPDPGCPAPSSPLSETLTGGGAYWSSSSMSCYTGLECIDQGDHIDWKLTITMFCECVGPPDADTFVLWKRYGGQCPVGTLTQEAPSIQGKITNASAVIS